MGYPVQRKHQRFKISAPVIVEIENLDAAGKVIVASTRDVSQAGVFVVSSDHTPTAGIRVKVHVDLSRIGQMIEAHGTVLRAEDWGFAVQFDVECDSFKPPVENQLQ